MYNRSTQHIMILYSKTCKMWDGLKNIKSLIGLYTIQVVVYLLHGRLN